MLLRKIDDRGYPVDYVLARLRGRRAHLITDWGSLIRGSVSPGSIASARYGSIMTEDYQEGARRHLMKEFGSVYAMLDGALRRIFEPFFLYVELRTIFISLRYAGGKEPGKIERILSTSLLSGKVGEILRRGEDLRSAVEGLEDCFISLSDSFAGLSNIFLEAGLPGWERALSVRFLEHVAHSGLHAVMKDFFTAVIDSRNLLSIYKYITLDAKRVPLFVSGGSIKESILKKIAGGKDLTALYSLVRELTGIEPGPSNIETALYRMVTGLLRRSGRDPLSVGLILDYLWRCSREAANMSILLYGRGIDPEIIAGELAG